MNLFWCSDMSTSTPQHSHAVIIAVVVTRNRLALLKQAIDALRAQTHELHKIFVVNNDSDDGTREWLDSQADVTSFHQANLGGSGGFHRGIREAHKCGADWVWCMDDDSICDTDALRNLLKPALLADPAVGLLSSKVIWEDGSMHAMNLPRQRGVWTWLWTFDRDRAVEIVSCSFVGMMISRAAIEACGLPIAEMFIWLDDVEYSERISQRFTAFLVADSVILHKTNSNSGFRPGNIDASSTWKYAFHCRNQFVCLRLHHSGMAYYVHGALMAFRTARDIAKLKVSGADKFRLLRNVFYGYIAFRPGIDFVTERNGCD